MRRLLCMPMYSDVYAARRIPDDMEGCGVVKEDEGHVAIKPHKEAGLFAL